MSKRRHSLVRLGLVLSVGVAPFLIQCGGSGSSGTSCPVGSEGCRCTPGDACDPGLTCLSNYCVDRTGGSEGGGTGDAGAPGAGGRTSEGGSPGSAGEPGSGGTSTQGGSPGAGGSGDAGSPGAGGSGNAGSPGTGGTIAQGGSAGTTASAGQAGVQNWAGAGGQAGAGGAGGSAGSAGSAGGPVELEPCTGSDDCEAGEICVYDVDGNGTCITGSQQPCGADLTCIKDMGFVPVAGIEGDICEVGGDCGVDDGHIAGICVDKAGDGSDHGCVAICQYAGDPAEFGCATHPQIGIWEACSRNNIRVFLAAAVQFHCAGTPLQSIICEHATPADGISSDFEWTLSCTMQATSCPGAGTCFTDSALGPDPDATQSMSQFFSSITDSGTNFTYAPSGGSGLGDACDTDCDCGRCNYCEGGECRYGGEGPYGCYRGCS